MNTHGIITEQERESIRARSSSTHKKQGNNYLTVNNERVEIIKYDLTPARTETSKAQPLHYDIKHVDSRNLLTVVMGRVSNQTGESFDGAMLRTKSADELWRRLNHADKLAEVLREILAMNHGLDGTREVNKANLELAAYEAAQ